MTSSSSIYEALVEAVAAWNAAQEPPWRWSLTCRLRVDGTVRLEMRQEDAQGCHKDAQGLYALAGLTRTGPDRAAWETARWWLGVLPAGRPAWCDVAPVDLPAVAALRELVREGGGA